MSPSVRPLILALAATASAQEEAGREAFERYGCASCHAVEGASVGVRESCVGCHQRVVDAPRSGFGRAPRVEHYVNAPELRNVTRRLREDYLVAYLLDPHDARPRLEETMPRLPVTAEDARSIVGFLRGSAGEAEVPTSPPPRPENIARGEALFGARGCPTCHELGNRDFGFRLNPEVLARLPRAAVEAPNLRLVRDRMDPDVALALRDFLFLGEFGEPAASAPPSPAIRRRSRGECASPASAPVCSSRRRAPFHPRARRERSRSAHCEVAASPRGGGTRYRDAGPRSDEPCSSRAPGSSARDAYRPAADRG